MDLVVGFAMNVQSWEEALNRAKRGDYEKDIVYFEVFSNARN